MSFVSKSPPKGNTVDAEKLNALIWQLNVENDYKKNFLKLFECFQPFKTLIHT